MVNIAIQFCNQLFLIALFYAAYLGRHACRYKLLSSFSDSFLIQAPVIGEFVVAALLQF